MYRRKFVLTAASYALELNLFCIAELILILYRVLRRNDRQLSQLKFRNMVTWHIAALFVNAVSPYIMAAIQDSQTYGAVRFILYTLYYSLLNVAIRSWVIFFVYSAEMEKNVLRRYVVYINISTFVLIFLNTTSAATHLFYYVENGEMVLTPFMNWQISYLFISQFVIAVLIVMSAKNRLSRPVRRRLYLVSSYPIIPFIFMALRSFIGKLPYLAVSNTMAILIIYIGYLDRLISVDPLTGINNRDHLSEYIQRKMDEHPERLCLVMFDINRFKRINDTYGHVEGDRALKLVTRALTNAFRGPFRASFLSRYGGDEFIAVLELQEDQAEKLLMRVREEVQKVHDEEKLPYNLTLSAGYAWYTREMRFPEDFVAVADKKLYEDKERMHRREMET